MTYQEKYVLFFRLLSQYPSLSPLQEVFYEEDITLGIKKLFLEKKYIQTKEDRIFVNSEYVKGKEGYTGKGSIIAHLSFIVFYMKVIDAGLNISLVSKKKKFLLAILSLKEKIVIGYGYKEVSQIAYQFFQENMLEIYYQYAGLILRDIEVYYGSVENFIEEE